MARVFAAFVVVSFLGCEGLVGPSGELDAGAEPDAGQTTPDASVPDAGGDEDAGRDAGAEPPDAGNEPDAGVDAGTDLVPVFVMVGKQGRHAVSCDDGRTWVADVSVDDAWPADERFRCFSGDFTLPDGGTRSTDCDHNAWSSTSVAFTGSAFIQTMGWGAPGTFHRSVDGVSWQQVFTGANVQDLMVGRGKLVAATRGARRSVDDGLTWTSATEVPLEANGNTIWNVRGGVFGGTGAFLVVGQDGSNIDFAVSTDDGATWARPQLVGGGRIDACGAAKPSAGGGLFITLAPGSGSTLVCRSADDAATWSTTTVPGVQLETRAVWTGTKFMAWGAGKAAESTDGVTWTVRDTFTRRDGATSGGPYLGAVAVNEDGTFVATRGGWQVWYEQQRFYRSTDGLTWDELGPAAAKRGHPITAMTAGRARCP